MKTSASAAAGPSLDQAFLQSAKAALQAMAAEVKELQQALGGASITEVVGEWLLAQLAAIGREHLASAKDPEEREEKIGGCVKLWSALQRGLHQATRLALERERLEMLRKKLWPPPVEKKPGGLSEETIRQIEAAAKLL